MQDLYRKQLAEIDPTATPSRPALAGYDRHDQSLLSLRRDIAVLIRGMGHRTYPLPLGPIFPAERFQIEDQYAEAAQLNSSVEAAFKRGRERYA